MNKIKSSFCLFLLVFFLNPVQAKPVRYQVKLVLIDDTEFRGTFDYDVNTQEITNLHGLLADTLMTIDLVPIGYQFDVKKDGKGGITASVYRLKTTKIATTPNINNNVYATINFNAKDPTLGVTDITQVGYMDCSSGGLMGDTCMYDLSWHDPVFPMAGGKGVRSEVIKIADNPISHSDCLFDWAEKNYPTLFSPALGSTNSQSLLPYYFRFYADQKAYLGISSKDNHIYYLPANGVLKDVGYAYDLLEQSGCK